MEVSLVRCEDYSREPLLKAIRQGLEPVGGIGRFVKPGERILLKPNLLSAKPAHRAVTTHPNIVWAMIKLVEEAGGIPLVGDSPGLGSTLKVAKACGVMDVVGQTSAELLQIKNAVKVDNPRGRRFKRFEVAEELLTVDGVINLPKLKTHAQMLLTMGVKNIFGCVPGKRKAQWHLQAGTDLEYFSQMMLDLHDYIKPRLTVMDAIISMEGNGPSSGDPVRTGFVAISPSALALDTVCASIVGKDVLQVPILKTAHTQGLEDVRQEKIRILGEKPERFKPHKFSFPPLINVDFAYFLPSPLKRVVKSALTSRPVIEHRRCTLCGVCVDVCPPKIMRKEDRIHIDYDGCIRCYCCQEVCPEEAIEAKQGWLKRLLSGSS
ncbi:MAG TPA: DUF362 domain-containing protein [Deltaproteobacteria bacterium]|nr:DUF362 domain-containing protein [Deltaproteobacteria bacterium]